MYGRRIYKLLGDGAIVPLQLKPPAYVRSEPGRERGPQRHSKLMPDGLFTPYVLYDIPGGATAVAIGDVTGDGRNDVVTMNNNNPDSIYVVAQTESGRLDNYQAYPANIAYFSIHNGSVDIADMNQDGLMDVIVGLYNAVGVWLQETDGTLADGIPFGTAHSSFSNVYKLCAADYNNDGLVDVASIDWGTQSHDLDVFLQNPGGLLSHSAVYTVPHGGYDDIDAGDVNHDGLQDLIVMSGQGYAYDNLAVIRQNSAGTFDDPTFHDLGGTASTNGVGVGDVNGDGRDDVVVSHGGKYIALFLQNDAGMLNSPVSISSYNIPQPVEVADIDGDGRKDVVTAHAGWLRLGVYLQNGDGSLAEELLYDIPYNSHYNRHGMAVGDINGDSGTDVVVAAPYKGLVILYNTAVSITVAALDIKPGSCPNPLNVKVFQKQPDKALSKKGGVLPVAILGKDIFDVDDVDVSTILLEGVAPLRHGIEDVATPIEVEGECDCTTAGPDGYMDLTLKFKTSEIVAAIGDVSHDDLVTLTISGQLNDGTPFEGTDCVRVIGEYAREGLKEPITTEGTALGFASPNPFNPVTRIQYSLAADDVVSLNVYDVRGKLVESLVSGVKPAGEHIVKWNAGQMPSGVYYYRLKVGNVTKTRKLILLK
jgi:hypothetical protein